MNTKPILFNTDMVRALLASRKTVTRRVVKPQPTERPTLKMCQDDVWRLEWWNVNEFHSIKIPICPGDILYVRETWQHLYMPDRVYIYKADSDGRECLATNWKGDWRPSIHMPKKAARIFLRVTDVWVERLQDITEEQATKEGAEAYHSDSGYYEPATLDFVETWNSTIKPADLPIYGWAANPWVLVIEFERISKEEVKN